jgi:hypothetical protein
MDQVAALVASAKPRVIDALARLERIGVLSSPSFSSTDGYMAESQVRQLDACPATIENAAWTHVQVTSTRAGVATVSGFECKKRSFFSRWLYSTTPYSVHQVAYHNARVRDLSMDLTLVGDICTFLAMSTIDANASNAVKARVMRCPFVSFADTLSFDSISKVSANEAHIKMSYGKRASSITYCVKLHKEMNAVVIVHADGREESVDKEHSPAIRAAFSILEEWRLTNQLVVGEVFYY